MLRVRNRYTDRQVSAFFTSAQKARHCENCNRRIDKSKQQLTVKGFLVYYLCWWCAMEALQESAEGAEKGSVTLNH